MLNIAVRDTGIGIPSDKLGLIFQPFAQADGSTTRKYGGTGLGLSIAGQLVELMGGKLSANSTEGKGSVFHFRAPFKVATVNLVDKPKPTSEQKSIFLNQSILIVDDISANIMVLRAMIEKKGGNVTAVGSGREALDLLKKQNFDLIFMDLQMPEMDGFQATEAIREINQNVPILAFSANAVGDVSANCRKAGMNGYLAKPVTLDQLENAASKLLVPKVDISEKPLSGLRFLVVEDDLATQKIYKSNSGQSWR